MLDYLKKILNEEQIEKLKELKKIGNDKIKLPIAISCMICTFILGIIIGYINVFKVEDKSNLLSAEINKKNTEIESLSKKVTTLDDTITKLNSKVKSAQPWFEMSEEQKKIDIEKLNKEKEEKLAQEKAKQEADAKKAKQEAEEKAKKQKQLEDNMSFFNNIYTVHGVGTGMFVIKNFAEASGYPYDIDENIASVKIYKDKSKDGDYVFFHLLPNSKTNLLEVCGVAYHQASTGKEVEINNLSDYGDSKYTKYNTHIIGNEPKEVSGIDDQRKFLFN